MSTSVERPAETLSDVVSRLVVEHGRDHFSLAYSLTGDARSAERLYRRAVTRALSAATTASPPDVVAVYARRAVFAEFLADRHRPTSDPSAHTPTSAPFFAYLDSLSAEERICMVMRFREGRSCVAIGRDLDLLATTARHHLASAIGKMGASFEALRLTRELALYGGADAKMTAEANGHADANGTPDALTAAFLAIDDEAGSAFAASAMLRDPASLGHAHRERIRSRTLRLTLAAVGAAASLAWAGWTIFQVALPSAAFVNVDPSPSAVPGPYGIGVLASGDVLAASSPWSPGDSSLQRVFDCTFELPDISPSPTTSTIDVVSDPVRDRRSNDFSDVPMVDRSCAQLAADSTMVTATITPYEGSLGGDRVSMVIKITNASDSPLAVYQESVGVAFELPWGALSTIAGSDRTMSGLMGTSLDTSSLILSIPESMQEPQVEVLQPNETLTVVLQSFSASRWLRTQTHDPDFVLTDDILRAVSLLGEMRPDDGVVAAFEAGEFIPRAGIFVAVAPTDPDSTAIVMLAAIQDAKGAFPSPSPSAS